MAGQGEIRLHVWAMELGRNRCLPPMDTTGVFLEFNHFKIWDNTVKVYHFIFVLEESD